MKDKMLERYEEAFEAGFKLLKALCSGAPMGKEKRASALATLAVGGQYSRVRATRANEASILLNAAKAMKLNGDSLAPVWENITGTKATLPKPEDSV